MREQKSKVRNDLLSLRKSLKKEEVKEKSRRIIEKLYTLPEYQNSRCIMCYVSFQNEVETHEFIKTSLKLGKRIAVPLVDNKNRVIIASEILNFEKDLVPRSLGILEPKSECIRPVEPSLIDMAIIPGVGFDISKNRIGFGAGYYDKFLPLLRRDCLKAAVAFNIQIVESLPVESHDMKMDLVICNDKVIR